MRRIIGCVFEIANLEELRENELSLSGIRSIFSENKENNV